MKVKLYIGENVPSGVIKKITRIIIRFTGNPALNDSFVFDIEKNASVLENIDKTFVASGPGILFTTTGATANETAANLVTSLSLYDTDSSITYSLSSELNPFGFNDVYIDVLTDSTDTITTNIFSLNSSAIQLLAPEEISQFDEMILSYQPLDLFDDENIEFTNKLSDIEKLSNVFMDVTQSFTIPATSNNSDLFQHYYDIDIDNTFQANVRALSYLEIDSIPYRYGTLQLESVQLKNSRPDNYKITFYGGVIQLTDIFGDDLITKLDYAKNFDTGVTDSTPTWNSISRFDYEYNETNFLDSLNNSLFMSGNVITPLIAYTNRDWSYGDNVGATDISTTTGAILDTELKPALRVMNIIEAIETKYGISFTRQFLGKAMFNNLFIWMNSDNETKVSNRIVIDNPLVDDLSPSTTDVIKLNGDFIDITTYKYNQGHGANVERVYVATYDYFIYPDVGYTDVDFKVKFIDENGNVVREYNKSDLLLGNTLARFTARSSPISGDNDELITHKIRIEIESEYSINMSVDFRGYHSYYTTNNAGGTALTILEKRLSNGNTNDILVTRRTENLLPEIKVVDFIQGLMKMFKLIIRPLSANQFYLNTLDGYYSEGNLLNINDYVDQSEMTINRPLVYNTLEFKFEKTNNVAGKKFRQLNDPTDTIGYGDLKSVQPYIRNTDKLNITVPFENMLFERMDILYPAPNYGQQTNIVIGQSISLGDNNSLSPNNSKPILFFNNGFNNNLDSPYVVKFRNSDTTMYSSFLIGNTNDEQLDQVTDTINWGAEVDPWHNQVIGNSLYLNYWSNWVNTIYDLKQRKVEVEAILPPRYIQELSLNDILLFNNNRYRINDMTVNLLNGNTKFTLFKEIYDWNRYSMPFDVDFRSYKFTPNGWYYTDYIDNGDSATIYGSFTGYNNTSYGRIVKLLPSGEVDTTFNPASTGFSSNLFAFQTITKQNDGKLIATGNFTSYNGTAANRIIRLLENGSIDTGFTYGTGFNNITAQSAVDSQGRIIVCGSYSSYSGVTSQRIIRLNSGGTVNYSTSTNGFNNVTNSVVINSDDSMYVGGYFSTYSGVTSNRLIKLTSGFTIDTSFNVGTGLNSNTTSQPVGLLPSTNDGVIVYGYFTQYSGSTGTTLQSNNRLIKLTSTGQKDESLVTYTGFNNAVFFGKKVLNGRMLFTGFFNTYANQTVGSYSSNSVILSENGAIYRTMPNDYINIYNIGGYFYGNKANGNTELLFDETVPTLDREGISANAGQKWYGINVLKDLGWTATLVDIGFGTDWIQLDTIEGTGFGECVFKVNANTTSNLRYMWIKFQFEDHFRTVLVSQSGI